MAVIQRTEEGATLVEFALLIPVLVMLLFGLAEFAVAYDRQQALTGAAREGARAASIGKTDAEVETRVNEATGGTTFESAITVTVTPSQTPTVNTAGSCDTTNSGTEVVVTVAVDETLSIPFVTERTITLDAEGSFLCE